MHAWSVKRRIIYGGALIIVLTLILGVFYFNFFYTPPTCSDGSKNGDETGVDCGGSCKNVCTSDALKPITLWSKVFNISGDVYTAVAFVQNPNINSRNTKAQYKFKIYDERNSLILEKVGETSIPKNKKFPVFEASLQIKDKKPKTVDFEWISFSPWTKDYEKEPDLFIDYGTLESTSTVPRIAGKIYNRSFINLPEVELDVLVFDSKENVVAAGRSFVDELNKGDVKDFVFTWPKPFNLGVEACLSPLDVVLSLDKSGSMKSESVNPPEPFTTVLSTAQNFIKNLTLDDQIGVVSFGTNANDESILSKNKDASALIVSHMTLSSSTEQTNITEGLQNSFNQLKSQNARGDAKKVIVLLTDGLPTEPQNKDVSDYPKISAQKVADEIKVAGIEIFTIGLGKNISDGFLKSISTDDNHYFSAPSKETLSSIYSKIGTGLCPKKPNVITVTYRVP